MTPNVELLRLTLKQIEAEPHAWDQTNWRTQNPGCGTVMCFAGWAVTLAGGNWYSSAADAHRSWLFAEEGDDRGDLMAFTRGVVIGARWRARRVLGLDGDQADRLFAHDNTLADLNRIVDELCAGVES